MQKGFLFRLHIKKEQSVKRKIMFSFGLFSSLAPVLIMLIVTAFGVVSQAVVKKRITHETQDQQFNIQISDDEDQKEKAFNPFTDHDTNSRSQIATDDPVGSSSLFFPELKPITKYIYACLLKQESYLISPFSRPPPISA